MSIYLHIPFCKQACYYCDFHFSTSLKRKKEMIAALVRELELRKNEISGQVETIYFGGGTPSLLGVDEIEILIETICKNYNVIGSPEITLEANPDDLTKEKIKELAVSPINRLSIGIQSFFDEDLQWMNRAHNARDSKMCLDVATAYFDNITIDLIYGIPGMGHDRWLENLNHFFNYGIKHLSAYALTVEPKTALANFIKKKKYKNVSDALAQEHFNVLLAKAEANGFVHYETSNFGKPGYFSTHNTAYWLSKPYLGIGPSAHAFNGEHRSWNVANNAKYLRAIANDTLPQTIEKLSKKDRFNEQIMTGLRTVWGVDLERVKDDYGLDFKCQLIENAQKFLVAGLLELDNQKTLKTTNKGKFLADGIAADLFV
ncbi:MAG: coproporphyrinogen III oxidase, partial [Flavobacteriales bacterium]